VALTLGAIDVGSNTIHLTVARITKGLTEVVRTADEADLVRLGADVNAHGAIGPERLARACAVIRRQVHQAHTHGAATVLAVATEAIRAAANGEAFIERVRHETGVHIELITGAQEAALTYWGATSGLKHSDARRAVADMGGGSLELVVGAGTRIEWRVSLPLGSATMMHRYTTADPPSADDLAVIERTVAETLAPLRPPLPIEQAIVCGGTASTLAALAARTTPAPATGERPAGHGRYLTRRQLDEVLRALESVPAAKIARRFHIDAGRARLLPAGGAVLQGAMDLLGVDRLRSRRRGIREGAMLTFARTGRGWLEAAASGALPS
jgi:exopolyphosphatase/guanosine-5'-triphosphate,3'-diphosphate pyrophosphatase